MALAKSFRAVNTCKTFNNVLSILAWDVQAVHFIHSVTSARRKNNVTINKSMPFSTYTIYLTYIKLYLKGEKARSNPPRFFFWHL